MLTLSQITAELATRAAEGDRRAVEEIVRSLQRPLYQVALKMLLVPQDAEDATQEALLRIVTHLGQYRAESQFSTWAWRIAVRRILDFRAQHEPRGMTFTAFAADLADGRDGDASERADDAILYRQLKTACSRALLQCLDGDHRIAFILGDLLELSSADAAEILEVEPATVRKRLSRARAELSAFLSAQCGIFDAAAPCACHRRVDRALALGRIRRAPPPIANDGDDANRDALDLATLRRRVQAVAELKRVATYYRSDAGGASRRDFVATIRSMLSASTLKEPS